MSLDLQQREAGGQGQAAGQRQKRTPCGAPRRGRRRGRRCGRSARWCASAGRRPACSRRRERPPGHRYQPRRAVPPPARPTLGEHQPGRYRAMPRRTDRVPRRRRRRGGPRPSRLPSCCTPDGDLVEGWTDAVTARSCSRMLSARLRLMVIRAVRGRPTATEHTRGTAGRWTGILAGRDVRASAVPSTAPVPADPAEGACQLVPAAGGGRRIRRPPPVAPPAVVPSVARQLITAVSVAVIAVRGLVQSKWTI